MIDPRRTFDRTTTPRVQDETNYNYNFSQNVPFYPFPSLNRIMLTYPSLTNTKFHLEKKKKEEERMIQKKPREVNVTKSAAIQEYIQ